LNTDIAWQNINSPDNYSWNGNDKSTYCQLLPPEVSDRVLRPVLSRYGEVRDIQAETFSRLYRYPVAHGIRLAMITLAIHIPSDIIVAGSRVLVSYGG